MAKKTSKSISIKLTDAQKAQIKKATGKKTDAPGLRALREQCVHQVSVRLRAPELRKLARD